VSCQPRIEEALLLRQRLPVPASTVPTAAVPAPASMETAIASAEAASTVKRIAAVEVTAGCAASVEDLAAMEALTSAKTTLALEAVPSAVTAAVPTAAVGPTPARAVETVEPGSSADKHAAAKIIRAIVAVRRACIRGIAVITIRAGGRRSNIRRSDPNADRSHSHRNLCMSVRSVSRKEHQKASHQSIL